MNRRFAIRFIVALVLLAVVCGGLVGFNIFRDRAIQQYFASMPVPPQTVSTTTAEAMRWTPGVDAIGTVRAVQGVDLTVETSGIVNEIRFKANDMVDAGAVLLQLDDEVERADLEAQKAQTSLAQLALNRALELQKRGVGTDVNLDTAQAASRAGASNVAKLQAVLDQKRLTAPFRGTVGIPRVEVGQYVTPGTVVVTLQNLETMRVDFTVPEQQRDLLKIGQTIRLGPGGADQLPFSGKILGIDPKIDPETRLVSVRGEVANPDGQLTPGQFVQVRVELPPEDGILALPQTALVTSLYGDFIYVVRPAEQAAGKPAPAAGDEGTPAEPAKPQLAAYQVFVKAGRRNEDKVEIVEGLKAGDQVVTAGQNRLSNGVPVTVDNTIDPNKPAAAADQQAQK